MHIDGAEASATRPTRAAREKPRAAASAGREAKARNWDAEADPSRLRTSMLVKS